jgi:hypothetical protein
LDKEKASVAAVFILVPVEFEGVEMVFDADKRKL